MTLATTQYELYVNPYRRQRKIDTFGANSATSPLDVVALLGNVRCTGIKADGNPTTITLRLRDDTEAVEIKLYRNAAIYPLDIIEIIATDNEVWVYG